MPSADNLLLRAQLERWQGWQWVNTVEFCVWTQSMLIAFRAVHSLTLKVLIPTTDAQWEGMVMGEVGVGEARAGTTSPMPDHKGFKLQ